MCVMVACSEGRAAGTDYADPSLRLDGAIATLDELGRHVIDALVAEDRVALEAVRLSEREHNEVVWPELPASAPEVNFPVDFAWSNIQGRNTAAVNRLLPIHGGAELVFQSVECRGEIAPFATFQVLTDCWLLFTRGRDAQPWQAQVFEDVLVRGGAHKIFRYYDEEPRRLSRAAPGSTLPLR